MSEPAPPDDRAETTGRSAWRRSAPFVVAGLAGLVAAAALLTFTQRVIDAENGLSKPTVAPAAKPTPAPAPPRREPQVDPGAVGMTHKEYEHLQRLPPYGVVKKDSALAKQLERELAEKTRDGGR